MTPSTEVGIFAPPIMAVLGFLMCLGRWAVGKGGKIDEDKAQFLVRMWLAIIPVAYVIIWWREISTFFS
jgi:hypothetical protein